MKISIPIACFTLSFFSIIICCPDIYAQDIPQRENPGVITNTGKADRIDLYKNLHLTREQQKNLQALAKETRQQVKAIQEDSTLSRQDKREKLLAVKNAQAQKRKTILTPEQEAQWNQNTKDQKGKREKNAGQRITNHTPGKKNGTNENGLSRKNSKTASKYNWSNLKLTEDQKNAIERLNEEYYQKLRAIKIDASKGTGRKEQLQQLQKEYNIQLGAILTPEQKAIWEDRKQRLKMTTIQRNGQFQWLRVSKNNP